MCIMASRSCRWAGKCDVSAGVWVGSGCVSTWGVQLELFCFPANPNLPAFPLPHRRR